MGKGSELVRRSRGTLDAIGSGQTLWSVAGWVKAGALLAGPTIVAIAAALESFPLSVVALFTLFATAATAVVATSILRIVDWVRGRGQSGIPSIPELPSPNVQFFANRDELDRLLPLAEQFKQGNSIHAFWVAGQGIIDRHASALKDNKVLREVVLPHPHLPALSDLTKSIETGLAYPLAKQIPINTDYFKGYGASVFWYPGFLGVGGHIGNPGREDAWVVVEYTLPCVHPGERQGVVIRGREAVAVWAKWYEELTKKSLPAGQALPVPPPPPPVQTSAQNQQLVHHFRLFWESIGDDHCRIAHSLWETYWQAAKQDSTVWWRRLPRHVDT